MSILSPVKRIFCVLITAFFFLQIAGCGTVLYPERRGQKGGRIDAGIAVLDAVGLFFFIIPGVVAFAVDYATGAIFLPGTRHSSLNNEDVRVIHIDPAEMNKQTIENVVTREMRLPATFDLDGAEVSSLKGVEDIRGLFAEMEESGFNTPGGGMKTDLSLAAVK